MHFNSLDIDECGSDPCDNGAVCKDHVDEYSCDCVAGYTGDTCETGQYTIIIQTFKLAMDMVF